MNGIGARPPAVVVHVPHASTVVPDDVRDQFVVTADVLAEEVRRMTDHHTDALFALPTSVAATVRFAVSRLVVDPERFEDDTREPMASRGMGVVYTRTSRQGPLRRALTDDERDRLLAKWYRPHHETFRLAVGDALAHHGRCLIIDAHSFPSMPLPYETDQAPVRPDICIGTDRYHTPSWLAAAAVTCCERAGWSVRVNRPFAGALVPEPWYGRDRRVTAVMVEVNRRLYLDEATGQRGDGFDQCRREVSGIVAEVVAAWTAVR